MSNAKIKYYGTLAATVFVLILSTDHISEALKTVEDTEAFRDSFISGTWLAAAGLQIFEVLVGVGIADLISRGEKSWFIMSILIFVLTLFFLINVAGNILYAFSNMAALSGREMRLENIMNLDALQIFWVLWAAIPIPLMGIAGITVQSIFRRDLDIAIVIDEAEPVKRSPGRPRLDKAPEPVKEPEVKKNGTNQ